MSNHYVLLSKQANQPRQPKLYSALVCSKLAEVLAPFTGRTALDFETTGLDPFKPGAYIRCVSLANHETSLAIDLKSLEAPALNMFWDWVKAHPGFVLHNATFDATWARVHGKGITVACCSATLFRHLSTEGWAGQSWSLKTAMTDVLGWEDQNTEDLYSWLSANKLRKGDMSQAPFEILGPYASMDADATWQLYVYLKEVIGSLPPAIQSVMVDYHLQDVLTEIDLLIEQQIMGMRINLEKLDAYGKSLELQIEEYAVKFIEHPRVTQILQELRESQVTELLAAEPEQMTKTGKVAARWTSWEEKVRKLRDLPLNQVFNIDSPAQLTWLFYEKLGYKIQRTTEKGVPSVDNRSLPSFDEYGQLLRKYRKLRDKLKFVTALQNVQQDGVLHPSMNMAGTVTGRLSGGNRGI